MPSIRLLRRLAGSCLAVLILLSLLSYQRSYVRAQAQAPQGRCCFLVLDSEEAPGGWRQQVLLEEEGRGPLETSRPGPLNGLQAYWWRLTAIRWELRGGENLQVGCWYRASIRAKLAEGGRNPGDFDQARYNFQRGVAGQLRLEGPVMPLDVESGAELWLRARIQEG